MCLDSGSCLIYVNLVLLYSQRTLICSVTELSPMGQALMSSVRAMKKKQDEESHALLGGTTSNVSHCIPLNSA